MKIISKITAIFLLISLTSCYSYSDSYYQSNNNKEHYEVQDSFFWGLSGDNDSKNLNSLCENDEKAEISSDNGVVEYFVRLYTLGIYWPKKVKIECVG